MNRYRTETGELINNAYIKLDYVRDLEELKALDQEEAIDTNIDLFSVFLSDLEQEEALTSKRKDLNSNYGVFITVMLPKETKRTAENLKTFTTAFMKKYDSLPYRAMLEEKGEGFYIKFYICERHYHPQGKTFNTYAKKDLYRDDKGRACTKEAPGAKIYKKKGDLLRTKQGKFSPKERELFRFSCQDAFISAMNKLKEWLLNFFEKTLNTVINTGICFKRFIIEKTKYKACARYYNRELLNGLEDEYSKALEALRNLEDHTPWTEDLKPQYQSKAKANYYDEPDSIDKHKKSLEAVFKEFNRKIQKADTFKYKIGKKSYKINCDLSKGEAKQNSEIIKGLFRERLGKIINEVTQ